MAAIGQTQSRPGPAPAPATLRTPLFVVGIVLAVFAFVAMFAAGLLLSRGSQSVTQVKVVVAAQDIQARQPITLDVVTMGQVPSNAVPPRSLPSLADITSLFAVVPIYKGEVLTANVLAANPDLIAPGQTSFLPIPQGYVAVTIPAGEQQEVAGYVSQGDYLDVIATVDLSQFGKHGTATMTVFVDLYVLRVGPETAAPRQGQPQGVASSLTVLMTECEAQYMTWLLSSATLRYTLLSREDYGAANPKPDPSCPSTTLGKRVTAAEVDARWGFTRP
jgi:pilus assembly protein CpaB